MESFRDGDVASFECLYKKHSGSVYGFLLKSVADARLAEDLLQDVFLKVVSSAAGYQPKAKFTTWLYTMVRNRLIDESRRARHRKTVPLDRPCGERGTGGQGDDGATLANILPDQGPSVESSAMDSQFRERLHRLLVDLPEEQRTVFVLRESHGLPFRDIAGIMKCPENTIKSRMRYALETLRKGLADLKEDCGSKDLYPHSGKERGE